MKEKINLWTLGDGKTKMVVDYVNSITPRKHWVHGEWSKHKMFLDRIKQVKSMRTANEMLEAIKYNHAGLDGVYQEIERFK